ncbi:malto-oligosyltrehalose trehalohydrolase [Demequina sp. TTPB684]|uniref:malto-oligosyltrehalose trehalohydrolase n=1 Tax=unclassified Demequina TaxID=2620311 RepID=UPI001CF493DE|nr:MULTISPECIES: malto-oligosyltrehalose trehalohydrolase [unclassified Demequina]MCB2414096.1 malto-oligosyltrehalose trehalohydrolase [Demequina sp. TTPB684]UPU89193.1 malto-oligosyltrehalose trehalohydrolase [Demequina sp. TMPB413]
MNKTTVWAPEASAVTCHVRPAGAGHPQTSVEMIKDSDGWWSAQGVRAGDDYAFEIDGEGPFPDPRSPWQPHGVHGFSRAFDASIHRWADGMWEGRDARGAVTYELHVGTFTPAGTLDAIVGRQLEDLAARGIEMIELMPVAAFPGNRGWGYDGVSLYAVHEAYGGPAALQRFVDAAHAQGIGVCLDVVYNHLGPDGNYLSQFGPYFTDAHETPWGWAVNLDQAGARGARDFIIDNALRWFEDFHIDALRLDAVHALVDDSPTHILAELSERTAALSQRVGRPLSLVAESDLNQPAMVTPVTHGGLGMTAQWADDVHHALHAYLTGETHGYYADFGSIEALDKAYRKVFVHDGGVSTFRGKRWGAPVPDEMDRKRFVVFASNHDQVGNRALGDRPSSALSPGAQAASLALILLSPFTPMLFMGEEYGETRPFMFFTDHDEPLGSAVSQGRMSEFAGHGWEELYGGQVQVPDPQDRQTFLRSKLGPGLSAAGTNHAAIEEWMRSVMQARPFTLGEGAWKRHPVTVTEAAARQVTMSGPVRVHANLSDSPMRVQGKAFATFGDVTDAEGKLSLAPDAVALVVAEEE